MSKPVTALQSCLLIVNPGASNYRKGRDYESQLKAYFGTTKFEVYKLSADDFKDSQRLQARLRTLPAGSLLAVHGGDGTVNWAINQLLALRATAPRQATVLPLWGGNACDLANMVNGKQVDDVTPILASGRLAAVYPLQYRLTAADKSVTSRFAMCYLSFGAVAYAAQLLDTSRLVAATAKLGPLRFLSEVVVSTLALFRAKKFAVEDSNGRHSLYDLLFVNGSRLAKVYPTPGKLEKPSFVAVLVRHKYPVLFGHLARLSRAWLKGEQSEERSFTLTSDSWMQYDGEVAQTKAGTMVHIVPADQPLTVLTTTLRS